jgi:hypothetical protein
MKFILVLLAAFAMVLPNYAQEVPDYTSKKNELNIGYFNLFNLMGTNTLGLGYKRAGSVGAFRIGAGFELTTATNSSGDSDELTNVVTVQPRVGYEFHHWFNRFRVHYGAEIAAGYSKYRTEYDQAEIENYYTNTNTSKSIAIRPLLGVSFFIHPSISIATEANMNIIWSKSESERDSNGSLRSSTSSNMSTSLGPLGTVSVNFHF